MLQLHFLLIFLLHKLHNWILIVEFMFLESPGKEKDSWKEGVRELKHQVLVSELQQIVMKGPEHRKEGGREGVTVPDLFKVVWMLMSLNRLILYIDFYFLLFAL